MAECDRRVALITGCGKENGIGAATAQKLARDGFIVAVSDVAAAGVAAQGRWTRRRCSASVGPLRRRPSPSGRYLPAACSTFAAP